MMPTAHHTLHKDTFTKRRTDIVYVIEQWLLKTSFLFLVRMITCENVWYCCQHVARWRQSILQGRIEAGGDAHHRAQPLNSCTFLAGCQRDHPCCSYTGSCAFYIEAWFLQRPWTSGKQPDSPQSAS